MAMYTMERKEFTPYPQGPSEGIIYDVEDLGLEVDPFAPPPQPGEEPKMRHRLVIKIESMQKMMEGEADRPCILHYRCNMGGHAKSNLRIFRTKVAGRALTEQEAHNFDDQEVIGVRVGYVVAHREGGNGATYANLDTIWRLPPERQGVGTIQNARAVQGQAPQQQQQSAPAQQAAPTQQAPPGPAPTLGDDLPF